MIVEEITAAGEGEGLRLDKFLSMAFEEYSRSFLKRAIQRGGVTVNGGAVKPRTLVHCGDKIRITLPVAAETGLEPEALALEVLYEDDDVVAINKPADMVVHPSRGHARGTLANALLHHCRAGLSDVNGPLRPGIVHRLDRDTSGVILCAKSNAAHAGLGEQFKDRRVHKEYLAVVRGRMEYDSGEIALPIGRDRRLREKMGVDAVHGRPAVSRYFVEERYERFTVVRVEPRTGRTHQIRVHLSAQRHPVVADGLYGGGGAVGLAEVRGGSRAAGERPLIARQALHARAIRFEHPLTGAPCQIRAPIPADLGSFLAALRGG